MTATGVAHELNALVEPMFGGEVPLRVVAWDGSLTGPDDAPWASTWADGTPRSSRVGSATCCVPGGRALIQQMSRTSRPGGGPFIEAFILMTRAPAGDR